MQEKSLFLLAIFDTSIQSFTNRYIFSLNSPPELLEYYQKMLTSLEKIVVKIANKRSVEPVIVNDSITPEPFQVSHRFANDQVITKPTEAGKLPSIDNKKKGLKVSAWPVFQPYLNYLIQIIFRRKLYDFL